jgi:hypothetical protein
MNQVRQHSTIPLRPVVGTKNWDSHLEYLSLIRKCWEEMPDQRPKVADIKGVIHQAMGGK